ncbi:hypothetical protein [Nocardia sp. NRRL S-836]|uniref:hypothetical protein n=1 Tax=Nocardia sp. NRRL S-836 TaxID=1519492 RepID=UPI0006ADB3B3|nr:hypothetical protein [Nocardia sp. NRRL S-836]KOV76738.1 hypothetical protein ADL03_43575 [Nocardia sp. NRRL S-836]
MSKRFDEALRLMRRHNGQDNEAGFAMVKQHAAEHLAELVEEFHREQDGEGRLSGWLLELIGEAADPSALPLFVAHLDDERLGFWAACGLEKLNTGEARTALYRHRANGYYQGDA